MITVCLGILPPVVGDSAEYGICTLKSGPDMHFKHKKLYTLILLF